MGFTKGRQESYTWHTDGTEYVISPMVISGTTGWTAVAAGDYAVTLGNTITAKLVYRFPGIIRTGEPHLESTQLSVQAKTGPAFEQYNHPTAPYQIPGLNANTPLTVLKG